MPEPILDLEKIDLTKVAYDRLKVAEVLPHRDVLALLDGVCFVDLEEKAAVGFMDVQPDMFWVPGHFPGNPVLPGVVLIEAAAQLSSFAYKLIYPDIADRLMVFGGIDHVRFRGIVRTGDRVVFVVKSISSNKRLSRSATQAFVEGKIVYEGEVLGINT